MAIQLKSTASVKTNGVKVLVYGQAGAGKTTLVRTLPNPVILSAEAGLLSLAGEKLPFLEITTMDELREAYAWAVQSEEARQFETIALDSISEIAEVCLAKAMETAKDPRQAYGEMQVEVNKTIRLFRDIPGRNVYFSAKLEKSEDEMGNKVYNPSAPGKNITQNLPYMFDEVFALRVERGNDGTETRGLMCKPDGRWYVKDRSGKLEQFEPPDLGAIIGKIVG